MRSRTVLQVLKKSWKIYFYWICIIANILIFSFASYAKINDPETLQKALIRTDVFPGFSILPATYLLIGLEVFIVVACFMKQIRRQAVFLSVSLFFIFTLYSFFRIYKNIGNYSGVLKFWHDEISREGRA
jgi:hypothetical protein